MANTWPRKLHGYNCPCRNKTCTQNHPGMCVYYDTSPAYGSSRTIDSGYLRSGPSEDSIAAEHEDIFRWEQEEAGNEPWVW